MQTHLRFGAQQELPAIFVRQRGRQRIARQLHHRGRRGRSCTGSRGRSIVRRGQLMRLHRQPALRRRWRATADSGTVAPGRASASPGSRHERREHAEADDVHACAVSATTALVNAVRSVQSRVSSVLAAGLMIALGLSALDLVLRARADAHDARAPAAQSTAASRAQGEMALPSLGRIDAPVAGCRRRHRAAGASGSSGPTGCTAARRNRRRGRDAVPATAAVPARCRAAGRAGRQNARASSPGAAALGRVFAREPTPGTAAARSAAASSAGVGGQQPRRPRTPHACAAPPTAARATSLRCCTRASRRRSRRALLPTQRFLLPKGSLHRLHARDRDRFHAARA